VSNSVGIATNIATTVSLAVATKPKTTSSAPVYGTSVKDSSGVYS
jgi:hypothetical protein